MISLLEIAQSINEVDDDKIIKYKDKDGESQEMTAGAAKKQPDEHPAKIAYNRMKDSDGGEKDSGGKLGGSDFDRDANRAADDEADDMDRDARFAADAEDDDKGYVPPSERDYDDDAEFAEKYGYDADATVRAFDDEEMEDIIDKMADDAGVSVDNPIELVKIVRNKDEYGNANLGDIHKHINDMAGKPKGDDDNAESDDIEISDANSGPIDRDDIMDMLKNDSEVVDKMGDDVYWDGMDLVSSKFDDDTIASVDGNMSLGDLKKQIMDYEEMKETININLKEKYERIFRSLK